jgi:hypothetical protein
MTANSFFMFGAKKKKHCFLFPNEAFMFGGEVVPVLEKYTSRAVLPHILEYTVTLQQRWRERAPRGAPRGAGCAVENMLFAALTFLRAVVPPGSPM